MNKSIVGCKTKKIYKMKYDKYVELSDEQRSSLEKSKRISNPGCYPTGFIGLTAPLVNAGILAPGTPLTVNAISGYSGGGKALMQTFESDDEESEPWSSYAFSLVRFLFHSR
jgi:N-acetyl-gamma-glutamyl-phosphate reductase